MIGGLPRRLRQGCVAPGEGPGFEAAEDAVFQRQHKQHEHHDPRQCLPMLNWRNQKNNMEPE